MAMQHFSFQSGSTEKGRVVRRGEVCCWDIRAVIALWRDLFSHFIGPFNCNAHVCVFFGNERHKLVKHFKKVWCAHTDSHTHKKGRAGSQRPVIPKKTQKTQTKGSGCWTGRESWHKLQLASLPNILNLTVWVFDTVSPETCLRFFTYSLLIYWSVLFKQSESMGDREGFADWAGPKFMLSAKQCVLNEGERRLACLLTGA